MAWRSSPQRIIELGVDLTRVSRLLELVTRDRPNTTIDYTGIDLFDARTCGESLTLKETHHRLSGSGAKVRLVPGDLLSALPRTANLLAGTDLIIVDARHTDEELRQVWPFVPRMVHPDTKVARYLHDEGSTTVQWLPVDVFALPSRRAA